MGERPGGQRRPRATALVKAGSSTVLICELRPSAVSVPDPTVQSSLLLV